MKLKELEVRLEKESLLMSVNGKKYIEKLETKLRSLEADLEQEGRRNRDNVKLARQMERNYKDMEYQYNQERRNYEKMEVKLLQSYFIISNEFLGYDCQAAR